MVATSDEIRRELQITRERMGDTLAELERKLNPRFVIQNHPMAALGVAFGTGVVLGTARKGEESGIRNLRMHLRQNHARTDHGQSMSGMVDELLDGVKGALVAAGTAKLAQFLESLMQQYGGNGVTHPSRYNGSRL